MPFTTAHPAAVIPLARRPFVFSALVVGSMAPDFAYFLLPTEYNHVGHTPAGLFTFCLPVGLTALLLFHGLLKAPLLSLLPDRHQEALTSAAGGFRFGTVPRFLWVAFSLLVGAVSHILWDSFTHDGGWAVGRIPILNAAVLETPYGTLRVFKLLQHGSTALGTIVLIGCYRDWLRRAEVAEIKSGMRLSSPEKVAVLTTILTLAAVAGLAYAAWKVPAPSDVLAAGRFVREALIKGMTAALVGALVYSIGWHLKRQHRKRI